MIHLDKLYRPITAQLSETKYYEAPPCEALRPYVRCFWGTKGNLHTAASDPVSHTLVTPDTCMDIILTVNFTENAVGDRFCGINETAFRPESQAVTAEVCTFAVRFYAWSVVLFSDDDMRCAADAVVNTAVYFRDFKQQLQNELLETKTIEARIAAAERFLLRRLDLRRENPAVMNAVYQMLLHKGNIAVEALARDTATGRRQLERLFRTHVGVSPKKLCDLIRYQYLWREIVFSQHFDIHDAVLAYGFCDQAHLLGAFKKYHTMTPAQAKQFACGKGNVAFLQDRTAALCDTEKQGETIRLIIEEGSSADETV